MHTENGTYVRTSVRKITFFYLNNIANTPHVKLTATFVVMSHVKINYYKVIKYGYFRQNI